MTRLLERVKAKVIEVGDCWEWQGAMQSRSPVPTMNFEGKVKPVRRHLAEAMDLPVQGKLATYKCGNPLCVHPDHLMVITRKKLQQRIAKEFKHHSNPLRLKKLSDRARAHSKLTVELAQAIRDAEGKQRDIAAQFGVTQATVSVIKRGVTWRDYTNPFTQLLGGLTK
jgi:hypothetical protein